MELYKKNTKLRNAINALSTNINSYFLPEHLKGLVKSVKNNNLTYLTERRLKKLAYLVRNIDSRNIDGKIVEAGCALGGSSLLITAAKSTSRKLEIYDVFGKIPPPSNRDGKDVHRRYEIINSGNSEGLGGNKYYGYVQNLYEVVLNNFEKMGYKADENNVLLVKGLLRDNLKIKETVSLAHIDVDWYEPVYFCLNEIDPWLSIGGYFVIDDYFDWSGCRDAVNKFIANNKENYSIDYSAGSVVLKKLK